MKYPFFLLLTSLFLLGNMAIAQNNEPWTNSQLMAPAFLAEKITSNQTNGMLVLCVGPGALIKGSVNIGAAHEAGNIQKLKDYLKGVKKNTEVIIYCGCCPFDKCPNIRPAFTALKEMGFKNARLLDLPKNIKADWLDKNYPAASNSNHN